MSFLVGRSLVSGSSEVEFFREILLEVVVLVSETFVEAYESFVRATFDADEQALVVLGAVILPEYEENEAPTVSLNVFGAGTAPLSAFANCNLTY